MMYPHSTQSISPFSLVRNIKKNRKLIAQMTRREVVGRYQGSFFGLAWSFFNPVLMLGVYTFVFSGIFKAKWGVGNDETRAQFALILFVGMIVHGLFTEVVTRSPGLIMANTSYVTKVVFPLEILPIVTITSAMFHTFVSMFVLLLGLAISSASLSWTVLLIPVVLLPLIILTLGISWFLASIGTYLRDVGQVMGMITTIMLFLSPVFYPVDSLPEKIRTYIYLNPLTFIIEQARGVLIYGSFPDWVGLAVYSIVAIIVALLGYAWFQKTRKGFADVL